MGPVSCRMLWICLLAIISSACADDWRDIRTGNRIPDEGYCDQPYTVITADGNWLCTMTTGAGVEGQHGQHIVATISSDRGKTWSELIDIEPADGPEASWAMPLVTKSGRIWVFYTYNGDHLRNWQGKPIRTDTVGWYCSKYSDDHGRTWSAERYRLPLPPAPVDRTNTFAGAHQLFWGIGKPITHGGTMWFAFSRVGKLVVDNSEGWFFRSDNILQDPPPDQIQWQLLPDGDVGLKVPEAGHVHAEQNLVPLSDGSLYCMYRTITGYPFHSCSRDGGHTWTTPKPATYTPGGRPLKTPRACPRIWKTRSGKYLFWYHNHSSITRNGFDGRNPVWVSGGVERNGEIHWSQPEILFYDPDPNVRISYPDLVEQDGRYWITETQKTIARAHEVDGSLFVSMWTQGEVAEAAREGLVLTSDSPGQARVPISATLDLAKTGGLSIECLVRFDDLEAGQIVLDGRRGGEGLLLSTTEDGTLELVLADGERTARWDCDPGVLDSAGPHHVVATVDSRAGILMFVVDGVLCDGGQARTHGWTWCDRELGDVSGAGSVALAPELNGRLHLVRLYGRPLRTSEAVANYLAVVGE